MQRILNRAVKIWCLIGFAAAFARAQDPKVEFDKGVNAAAVLREVRARAAMRPACDSKQAYLISSQSILEPLACIVRVTCSQDELHAGLKQFQQDCPDGKPPVECTQGDECGKLSDGIFRNGSCRRTAQDLNNKCFGGKNCSLADVAKAAQASADKCGELSTGRCPPAPIPVPPPPGNGKSQCVDLGGKFGVVQAADANGTRPVDPAQVKIEVLQQSCDFLRITRDYVEDPAQHLVAQIRTDGVPTLYLRRPEDSDGPEEYLLSSFEGRRLISKILYLYEGSRRFRDTGARLIFDLDEAGNLRDVLSYPDGNGGLRPVLSFKTLRDMPVQN